MNNPDPRLVLTRQLDELAALIHIEAGVDPASGDSSNGVRVETGRLGHRGRTVAAVSELQRRLREDRIRILIVGESKRGKSTFTNALIGTSILPTGVTPLTAVATTVTFGTPPQVQITTRDGSIRTEPLDALPALITEQGNPGNRRGLARVVVQVDAPLLREGVELVDTPGTGSVNEANTTEAEAAFEDMDAAIVVLTADPPISGAERELLQRILPSSVTTFVVLNKADRLSGDELEVALDFTRRIVAEVAGQELPVYVCSARQALDQALGMEPAEPLVADPDGQPAVSGIDGLLADFTSYLQSGRAVALLTSLRTQGASVAAELLDAVALTVRAVQFQNTAAAGKVQLFRDHLDTLKRHQSDADDLAHGESRRLLGELNEDAAQMEAEASRNVISTLRSWLQTAESDGNAETERRGHELGSEVITNDVEVWRTAWASTMRKRLDELDERLRSGLDRDVADLRPAARELLGIELAARPTEVTLADSHRFFYQFNTESDAAGMLAAGIRHRLPGRLGRTRASNYLLKRMNQLARQQVGRARADIQERLTVTTRAMRSALSERYSDHNGRMLDALDAATRMNSATAEEAAAQRAKLDERHERLAALWRRMSEPPADALTATSISSDSTVNNTVDT